MPTIRIQVAGTEGPQMGKKRGRIKDTAGTLYQALPSFLGMVQIGGTYDLTYKDDSFNGTSFRVVEGIVPALGESQGQAPGNYGVQGAPRQERSHTPVDSDERGTDIATMAIVKEWIGRIPVGDTGGVVHALRAARRAWKIFKANPDNIESGRQYDGGDGA